MAIRGAVNLASHAIFAASSVFVGTGTPFALGHFW